MPRKSLLVPLAAVLMLSTFSTGAASTFRGDNIVQVGGRVASFLQPPVSGATIAAIVYEPGDMASEAEARSIERAMGSGMLIGSLRLKPKRVATNALAGLTGAQVAFVTRGTDYKAIASAASPRSVLTISADPACSRAGYCVVGVSSIPKVQIFVSKAATRAAKLRFNSSFLMLVKEV